MKSPLFLTSCSPCPALSASHLSLGKADPFPRLLVLPDEISFSSSVLSCVPLFPKSSLIPSSVESNSNSVALLCSLLLIYLLVDHSKNFSPQRIFLFIALDFALLSLSSSTQDYSSHFLHVPPAQTQQMPGSFGFQRIYMFTMRWLSIVGTQV